MKNHLISTIKFILTILIFIFLFIIPTILIPVSESLLEKIDSEEMKLFFPLLLIFAIYITSAYWMIIKNTNTKKIVLFTKLVIANIILYPLMGLVESFFWLDSLGIVDSDEIVKIFFRFLITFTLFSAYLSVVYKRMNLVNENAHQIIRFKQICKKLLLIAGIYLIIYNLFGYFVAWQFEATRVYYTGQTELKSFSQMLLQNFSDPQFVIVHYLRGILFGLSGYIIYTLLDCSRIKKILILSLIFGGFGFQIILPNPIFPEMVRISHFIETTLSMMIFGLIMGLVFSYPKDK